MGFFFLLIVLTTAGLCLAMGSISLFNGMGRDGEKVDLVFGCVCLDFFIFLILPTDLSGLIRRLLRPNSTKTSGRYAGLDNGWIFSLIYPVLVNSITLVRSYRPVFNSSIKSFL